MKTPLPFGLRAAIALCTSVTADALDYIGFPIFSLPVVGDIADALVIAVLYKLTGSKKSAAINAIELVPFVGDLVPTYTISTLIWILGESRRRRSRSRRTDIVLSQGDSEATLNQGLAAGRTIGIVRRNRREDSRTAR